LALPGKKGGTREKIKVTKNFHLAGVEKPTNDQRRKPGRAKVKRSVNGRRKPHRSIIDKQSERSIGSNKGRGEERQAVGTPL